MLRENLKAILVLAAFLVALMAYGFVVIVGFVPQPAIKGFVLDEDVVLTYTPEGFIIGTTLGPGLMDGCGFAFVDTEWPNKGSEPIVFYDYFVNVTVPFLLYSADSYNALLANGKKIELDGYSGNAIWLLYCFAGNPAGGSGTVKVGYEGGEATFDVNFLDWCSRYVNAKLYASTLSESHHPAVVMYSRAGARDGRLFLDYSACELFALKLDLGGEKKITYIEFPDVDGKLWLFAITIESDGKFLLLKSGGGFVEVTDVPKHQIVREEWDVPKDAKVVVYLFPYSHWDPDWLEPWVTYRDWAAGTIASAIVDVIKNPKYRFNMDTICFIRYFYETYPEAAKYLKLVVKAGLIDITGGSITEPAENLVSLEGLDRNLLYGIKWMNETLGVAPKVFTQADPFGHCPITPAWLKAHGFKYFYFGRWAEGMTPPLVFKWVSPVDNTSYIIALATFYGDYYWPLRTSDRPLDVLRDILNKELARLPKGVKIAGIVIGADFIKGFGRLVRIAETWNSLMYPETGIYLKVATFTEFFEDLESEVDKLPERTIDINPLWKGFYASRIQGKLYERSLTDRLLAIEKALIALKLSGADVSDVLDELADLWWLLSMNHHHDTVTGTSPDKVWFESELPRFEEVDSRSLSLLQEVSYRLANSLNIAANNVLLVYNNLPWPRNEVAIITVPVTGNFTILDSSGSQVPFEVLSTGPNGTEIAVLLSAPAYGYSAYIIANGNPPSLQKVTSYEVIGDLLNVTWPGGVLEVDLSKAGTITKLAVSGAEIRGNLGYIAVYEDEGNAWTVSITGLALDCLNARAEIVNITGGSLVLKIKLKVSLDGYEYYKTITIDLVSGAVYETYEVSSPNLYSHYLIVIKSTVSSGKEVYHGVQAGFLWRPIGEFYPAYSYVDVETDQGGLVIVNYGMPGVRALKSEGGVSVEVMAFRHLVNIRDFAVTDPGPHKLTVAYLPHLGSLSGSWAIKKAAEINRPLVTIAINKTGTGSLPAEWSLLSAEPEGFVLVDAMLMSSELIITMAKLDSTVESIVVKSETLGFEKEIQMRELMTRFSIPLS